MEYGRSTRSRDFRAVLPFTRKYTKTKFEGVFFRQSAVPEVNELAWIHALPIADLTPNLLSSLKAQLLKTPTGNTKPKKATKKPKAKAPTRKMLAGQTVNNIFSFMRSAINRAVATGMWSGVNPLSTKGGTWKMVKANNERLRFLTREEAKSLLDDLEKRHPQLHDMALLSLRTGLRPTEIFKLAGRMWTAMPAASISFRRE